MDNNTPYTSSFFQRNKTAAFSSAQLIVPFLLEVINPLSSVVDVGCGEGTWLSEFYGHGIEDILGLDGDYVGSESLRIPKQFFEPRDLHHNHKVHRMFDLAMSLEVAEHIPEEFATNFVHFLCMLSPVVFFSAAIPGQVGINHVNEQWQSYWAEKFAAEDYVPVDCIRPLVWEEPAVAVWYAQNSFLYVRRSFIRENLKLLALSNQYQSLQLNVVHPRLFSRTIERGKRSKNSGVKGRLKKHFRYFQLGK
jgi:hypothetical protein